MRGLKFCKQHGVNATHDTEGCEMRLKELHMQKGGDSDKIPFANRIQRPNSKREIQKQKSKQAAAKSKRIEDRMSEVRNPPYLFSSTILTTSQLKAVAKYLTS